MNSWGENRVNGIVLFSVALFVSGGANAVLMEGSILNIGAGSSFTLELAPGSHVTTVIIGHHGLITGASQAAAGSHVGAPNGSESPGIDAPWSFFGDTGMHLAVLPVSVLSANGSTAWIDMRGWAWSTVPYMPLGTGAWGSSGWYRYRHLRGRLRPWRHLRLGIHRDFPSRRCESRVPRRALRSDADGHHQRCPAAGDGLAVGFRFGRCDGLR